MDVSGHTSTQTFAPIAIYGVELAALWINPQEMLIFLAMASTAQVCSNSHFPKCLLGAQHSKDSDPQPTPSCRRC